MASPAGSGETDSPLSHRRRFDSQDESVFSEFSETFGADEEINIRESQRDLEIDSELDKKPVVIVGIKLPLWMTSKPSWNRVSAFVVTRLPCFCCLNNTLLTDRSILRRLNVLSGMLAVIQVIAALWLAFVMLVGTAPLDNLTEGEIEAMNLRIASITNIWNLNGAIFLLGLVAMLLVGTAAFTIRVIADVNLVGAIRYLWVLLWIFPFECFFVIGLYDYFRVTDVWIAHWWRDETMSRFREWFCEPGTATTLCTVPIFGKTQEERQWCFENYNSTRCTDIRDGAQTTMARYLFSFYYANGILGVVVVLILFLVVSTLQDIISRPVVEKSRQGNVPAWFALPIMACITLGAVFAFSDTSALNIKSNFAANWIGPVYLSTGGLFFVAAMIGWYISRANILNTNDKRRKTVAISAFIVTVAICLILLVIIFGASIAFSSALGNGELTISDDLRGTIACFIDQVGSCTRCEEESNRCPEWTKDEVESILKTQAKGSAAMSAIFFVFALSALRFGIGLRRHLALYQIDYI